MGLGHAMRCMALAEEAASRGWSVRWVGDFDSAGRQLTRMLGGLGTVKSGRSSGIGRLLREEVEVWAPDVLHVDSYLLGLDEIPRGAYIISAAQDGVHGRREADLAIDGNLGASERPVGAPFSTHYLLDLDAVAIRDQVRQRRTTPEFDDGERRVLVVLGGTDPTYATSPIVSGLNEISIPLRVSVVAPTRRRADLERLAAESPHQVELFEFVEDLPALAQDQHLVVSAAGSSVWDFACMGMPTAIVCVAENQVQVYRSAVEAGISIGLGSYPGSGDLGEAVRRLGDVLTDPDHLLALSAQGLKAVDGLGTWRIVGAWEQLVYTNSATHRMTPSLSARPALFADSPMLFAWRNDPDTRALSRSSDKVSWEEHSRWLSTSLERTSRQLFIIEAAGSAVGTVRFDHLRAHDWEVSITIDPSWRGRGLAVPMLEVAERALQATGNARLLATIHQENLASRRAFATVGFFPHLPVDPKGFLVMARWRVAGS